MSAILKFHFKKKTKKKTKQNKTKQNRKKQKTKKQLHFQKKII